MSNNLLGIHSIITDFTLNKNHTKKYLEHSLVTQALSAWWWKKLNGPIHLYTTEHDALFLEKIGILHLYDYVNTEVLSREENIPWDLFKSTCKMRVAAEQNKFPFVTIDTDLIFRNQLTLYNLYGDLTFLYNESYSYKNHPPLEFIGKREDYKFPEFAKMQNDLINTSFLIWHNPQLVRDYWNLAYDFIKNNNSKDKEAKWANTENWKQLFVEQKLLTNLIEKDNYDSSSLFQIKYIEDAQIWVNAKGEKQNFKEIQQILGIDFYHLWNEKLAFYDFRNHICTGNQIRTFYQLLRSASEVHDDQLNKIIDEIIIFTIEKTYELGLQDLYELRAVSKHLLI